VIHVPINEQRFGSYSGKAISLSVVNEILNLII